MTTKTYCVILPVSFKIFYCVCLCGCECNSAFVDTGDTVLSIYLVGTRNPSQAQGQVPLPADSYLQPFLPILLKKLLVLHYFYLLLIENCIYLWSTCVDPCRHCIKVKSACFLHIYYFIFIILCSTIFKITFCFLKLNSVLLNLLFLCAKDYQKLFFLPRSNCVPTDKFSIQLHPSSLPSKNLP